MFRYINTSKPCTRVSNMRNFSLALRARATTSPVATTLVATSLLAWRRGRGLWQAESAGTSAQRSAGPCKRQCHAACGKTKGKEEEKIIEGPKRAYNAANFLVVPHRITQELRKSDAT